MTWWMLALAYFLVPLVPARIYARNEYNKVEEKAKKWDERKAKARYDLYMGDRPRPMSDAFWVFFCIILAWPMALLFLAGEKAIDGISAISRKDAVKNGFKRAIIANDPKRVRNERSKAQLQARINELEEELELKDAV